MICPKCGTNRAHRSHRTWLDRIASLAAFNPYRCRDCHHRFYAFRGGAKSPRLRTKEERRIMKRRRSISWKRTKGELILYGIGSLIFLAILYYMAQQRVLTGSE